MSPAITSRPYRTDDDFWKLRHLLIDAFPITPLGWNWDLRRWDGERFHDAEPDKPAEWMNGIRFWETPEGHLAGAAFAQRAGEIHLQLHPDFRHLEAEMLAWAEEHLAGKGQVELVVQEYDALRQALLADRGYQKTEAGEMFRRMRFGARQLPERHALPDGYSLRHINPDNWADCERIARLLNTAFRRTFHSAQEYHNFTHRAPSYRAEMDLIAVAPDDTIVTLVSVNYVPEIRFAIFEPVCTHLDHRQKGLAQSLMIEGLHRARAFGAHEIAVGTGDMVPANALYNSLGFDEAYKAYAWVKTL